MLLGRLGHGNGDKGMIFWGTRMGANLANFREGGVGALVVDGGLVRETGLAFPRVLVFFRV